MHTIGLYPPNSPTETDSSSSSETNPQSPAASSCQTSDEAPIDMLTALSLKSLLSPPENRSLSLLASSSVIPTPLKKHPCLPEDLKEMIVSKQTAISKIKSLKSSDLHPHKQNQLPQILQKQFNALVKNMETIREAFYEVIESQIDAQLKKFSITELKVSSGIINPLKNLSSTDS